MVPPPSGLPSRERHDPDPATGLDEAMGRMTFTVLEARYALIGFVGAPHAEDVAALESPPAQLVREADLTTILVVETAADPILARHPGAVVERDLAWIRFDAPMAWDVVGFLARVSGALARAGVPIGAVCAFHRDHLFIAARHLPKVRTVLSTLFPERSAVDVGPGAASRREDDRAGERREPRSSS